MLFSIIIIYIEEKYSFLIKKSYSLLKIIFETNLNFPSSLRFENSKIKISCVSRIGYRFVSRRRD